ncbi:MAG: glycerol-3-phosphate 1-O-acyltransferase PlsY [Bacteroidia bacterium]|nr:glycerol-3-phosphate 1-O-acyltransferase PlsY [Bacteroidia bacterium]
MEVIVSVGLMLLAYVLGSLTPGVWIARARGVDIRKVGSGNIGSTNVYRTLGFFPGAIVQLLDISKAMIGVALAQWLHLPLFMQYLTATAAVMGHIYPIWGGFRGGKGINTLLGGMLLIEPWTALAAVGTFLGVLAVSRIVSVSSIVAVASFLLWHPILGGGTVEGIVAGLFWVGLVVYTHRANIARLRAGTEPRLGASKS